MILCYEDTAAVPMIDTSVKATLPTARNMLPITTVRVAAACLGIPRNFKKTQGRATMFRLTAHLVRFRRHYVILFATDFVLRPKSA